MTSYIVGRSIRSHRKGIKLWASITLVLATITLACGPSEEDALRSEVYKLDGEVHKLEVKVAALQAALWQANESIRESAEAIEWAQATVGASYSELSDAVEAIPIPDEVPVLPAPFLPVPYEVPIP
jgi:hypothetical protein